MSNSNKLQFEQIRTFNSSSMTGSYQALGSAFTRPILILKMVNNSDQDVEISYDGSTDHDICPASGDFVYDASKYNDGQGNAAFATGTQVYLKGTAGSGTIYLVAIHS